MRRILSLPIIFAALVCLLASPSPAQQSGSAPPPTLISGVIQSFSANTLDVKPAASPAIWVMIPDNLHVDRNALKPGAEVSVEAHWADYCYIATQVTIKK